MYVDDGDSLQWIDISTDTLMADYVATATYTPEQAAQDVLISNLLAANTTNIASIATNTANIGDRALADLSNVGTLPTSVKDQLKGDTGAAGSTGNTGAAGSNGATGSQGPIGNTGAAGSNGSTGSQGPIGNTGATGSTGSTGSTGAAGSTGSDGASGAVFFNNTATEGHYYQSGGTIYMFANGGWKQIFPAVYSA